MVTTSEYAIDLDHVAKTYRGRVRALRGIQMKVRKGEIFGLLGPNGAGKSTLVKVLMTVISPTECRGTMLGEPVGRKGPLARVGYLPENPRFADYLTGKQVLDYFAALSGVPRATRQKRVPELLALVGMSDWARKRVGSYSKGMRQRIGLAQALVNDPDLVLLDEPTDGVDPVGRRDIREVLQKLKSRGQTVFLNSHLLSELEMVCDRVAILVQGLVSAQGTLDELTRDQQRYEVEVEEEAGLAPALAATPAVTVTGAIARIPTTDAAAVQPVIDAARRAGLTIRAVRAFRPSLEDLFMQAVTDKEGRALAPGAARDGGGR